MQLIQPIRHVFEQLTASLDQLSGEQYQEPLAVLSGSTIGQHVRHIIELFQCLENGYETGMVNYEKRKRDYRIETNKNLAAVLLQDICKELVKPNKSMVLESEDYTKNGEPVAVPSNYYREILYNLEHTIHHMALIRAGFREFPGLFLPAEFGVAYSTIKYREQCAQ